MNEQTASNPTEHAPTWWPDEPLAWALDRWVQLLGITFLLIGVGFLFKYTYEHGLLKPPLRVLCGAGVSGMLAVAGWRIRETRRSLSHVLIGGASASMYVTLYAASELYSLIPNAVAFAGFVGVTMATFVAAVRQRGVMLANVATVAAYLTPFVLDVPLFSDPTLRDLTTIGYMSVVTAGSAALYLFNGWRSVLVTSVIFFWPYLALVALGAGTPLEKGVAQASIVFAWAATGALPVARAYFARFRDDVDVALPAILTLAIPALAVSTSAVLWGATPAAWAIVSIAMSCVYVAARYLLRDAPDRLGPLVTTQGIAAIGLFTAGLTALFSGPSLMVALLIEGVALCWVGKALSRWTSRTKLDESLALRILGHVFVGVATMSSIGLFASDPSGMPFFNEAGVQLMVTVLGVWLVGQTHDDEALRAGFEWGPHIFLLGTVLHQTSAMTHGDLVATACWGTYSLALIASGLVSGAAARQWMGLSALLLTAGKLLFVDMSGAETLWRVLLFMSFGAALLLLNYLSPRWKGPAGGATGRVPRGKLRRRRPTL